MDKNSLLSRFAESTEEKTVLSHILDLAQRSWSRSTVESGSFLSNSLKMRANEMLCLAGYKNYFFFGGFEGAERTCPVFFTEYCTEEMIKATPTLAELTYVRAELDKFNKGAEISHRDVLGSLMGLGIERDSVGDISVNEGFALFVVKEAIAPFIAEELTKIGRYPVTVTLHEYLKLERHEDFEEGFDTVASLRLDAVVASLFSTSRSVSAEAIEAGLVAINGAMAKKCDSTVSEGDKISFRGRGRAELEKIDGLSKKGRTRILYKRWK